MYVYVFACAVCMLCVWLCVAVYVVYVCGLLCMCVYVCVAVNVVCV